MADRESFLARVGEAARRGQQYRVHLNDKPGPVGYVGADADLCAAMAKEVDAVGGIAQIVDDCLKRCFSG